jgi:hypothetical protein
MVPEVITRSEPAFETVTEIIEHPKVITTMVPETISRRVPLTTVVSEVVGEHVEPMTTVQSEVVKDNVEKLPIAGASATYGSLQERLAHSRTLAEANRQKALADAARIQVH